MNYGEEGGNLRVFISWSGVRSGAIAKALKAWLPDVIQAVDPWMSPDIEKGTQWSRQLAENLDEISYGVVCLTKDNLNSTWLHYEAGALSKPLLGVGRVATMLYDITAKDVKAPLGQLQHTNILSSEDMRKFVGDLNRVVAQGQLSERKLDSAFTRCWPELEAALKKVPEPDENSLVPARSDAQVLEEVLEIVREIARRLPPSEGPTGETPSQPRPPAPSSSSPSSLAQRTFGAAMTPAQASSLLATIAASTEPMQSQVAQLAASFAETYKPLTQQLMSDTVRRIQSIGPGALLGETYVGDIEDEVASDGDDENPT